MTREEVRQNVVALLTEEIGEEEHEIADDLRLREDLDLESIDLWDMILKLEDRFKIKIPNEEVAKLFTVGQVINYVCRRLGIVDEEEPPLVITHE